MSPQQLQAMLAAQQLQQPGGPDTLFAPPFSGQPGAHFSQSGASSVPPQDFQLGMGPGSLFGCPPGQAPGGQVPQVNNAFGFYTPMGDDKCAADQAQWIGGL